MMQIPFRRARIYTLVVLLVALTLPTQSVGGQSSKENSSTKFHFVDGDGYRELHLGDTPVYRYVTRYDPADHASTLKPFHHVYGFHDEGFLTKGPGGWFTHHRGIFFGFKTQYGDFWHCPDVSQRHVKFLEEREQVSNDSATTASATEWIDKTGKAVVRDTREVTAKRTAEELVLDFVITVESLPGAGEVQLGGDPHHAGFHFRASQEVSGEPEDSQAKMSGLATFVVPAGAKAGEKSTLTDANWVASAFKIKDHPYVVAHFDHASNPRPIDYSVRPYGRFGSFCPMTVKEGEPLTLKYRIIIMNAPSESSITPEALAKRYDAYSAGK